MAVIGNLLQSVEPGLAARGTLLQNEARGLMPRPEDPLTADQKLQQGYIDAMEYGDLGLLDPRQTGVMARDLSTGFTRQPSNLLASTAVMEGRLLPETERAATIGGLGQDPYFVQQIDPYTRDSYTPVEDDTMLGSFGGLSVGVEPERRNFLGETIEAKKASRGGSTKTPKEGLSFSGLNTLRLLE